MYSMTGYGKSSLTLKSEMFFIEIKTLNSKYIDIHLKMPSFLKILDIEVRNTLSNTLKRGKIECSIFSSNINQSEKYSINKEVLEEYFKELSSYNVTFDNALGALLTLPNVVTPKSEHLTEKEKTTFLNATNKALNELQKYRKQEGKAIEKDFLKRISLIKAHTKEIEKNDSKRILNLKKRLYQNLKQLKSDFSANEERLEQELFFYSEKLDITEELVRLKSHCKYFEQTLKNKKESVIGKKLNFICQEIGREINTIGSKANDTIIQKHVVEMKNELEKIKEQVNNVL